MWDNLTMDEIAMRLIAAAVYGFLLAARGSVLESGE